MAGVKITKVKAGALLEVLVAITILMTVVVIGSVVFVNVTGSSFTGEKLRAGQVIEKIRFETVRTKAFFDEEFKEEGMVIKRKVGKYKGSDRLLELSFEAFNSENRLLADRKEILVVSNEKN